MISGVLSDMRLALGGAVEGLEEYKSLADIGITTGTWFENGKLYLNEEKLRSALSDNADEVRDLFTQAGEGKEQGDSR